MRANAGDDVESYESALAQLVDALDSIAMDQTYSFLIEPNESVVIYRDGERVETIRDAAFARLFPALYLGEAPPTAALKRGLLGRGLARRG